METRFNKLMIICLHSSHMQAVFSDISSFAAFMSPADLSIWFTCLSYCTCSALRPLHISHIPSIMFQSGMKENGKGELICKLLMALEKKKLLMALEKKKLKSIHMEAWKLYNESAKCDKYFVGAYLLQL